MLSFCIIHPIIYFCAKKSVLHEENTKKMPREHLKLSVV